MNIPVVIGIIAFFVGIIVLLRRADSKTIGKWDTYAVCKCGWYRRAPFGNLFHLFEEVCPDCGEPKNKCMTIKTRRWNGPLDAWEEKDQ